MNHLEVSVALFALAQFSVFDLELLDALLQHLVLLGQVVLLFDVSLLVRDLLLLLLDHGTHLVQVVGPADEPDFLE